MGKRTQYIVYKYIIHLRDKAFIHPNTFSTFVYEYFFYSMWKTDTVNEHAHSKP